ncbi:hypothetical protein [Coraliomargarita parva]|uniref:hypothetical protein n=1 Tax=Coraliomargarita parva TaxID=3014050 RepID=UPI0022B4C281|nr:hypothetical protein [Coraliomargarita parva]
MFYLFHPRISYPMRGENNQSSKLPGRVVAQNDALSERTSRLAGILLGLMVVLTLTLAWVLWF